MRGAAARGSRRELRVTRATMPTRQPNWPKRVLTVAIGLPVVLVCLWHETACILLLVCVSTCAHWEYVTHLLPGIRRQLRTATKAEPCLWNDIVVSSISILCGVGIVSSAAVGTLEDVGAWLLGCSGVSVCLTSNCHTSDVSMATAVGIVCIAHLLQSRRMKQPNNMLSTRCSRGLSCNTLVVPHGWWVGQHLWRA